MLTDTILAATGLHPTAKRIAMRNQGIRRQNKGFTLIELMISLLLGSILIAVVASVFGSAIQNNAATLRSARLNQDLSAVLQIAAGQIRRAGFTDGQVSYDDTERDVFLPSSSCIVYGFNNNRDTVVNADERYGLDLNGGAVRLRQSCGGDTPPGSPGTCGSDCVTGNWERITDEQSVTITELTFSTLGSKCYNLETDSFWVVTDEASTTFPCDAVDGSEVEVHEYDAGASPPIYVSGGTFAAPTSGDRLVETRQVKITIAGTLAADSTISKKMSAEVKVRNDRARIAP